jgi:hypothetical protein
MKCSISPALFLEAPAFPVRQAARRRVRWFDYLFFTLVLTMICGGALFMLELGSSQNGGGSSISLTQVVSQGSAWVSVLGQKVAYYGLLFLASVLNSAFMVIFVQLLRTLDRRFSRSRQRRWPSRGGRAGTPLRRSVVQHVTPRAPAPSIHRSFLLNPITR